MSRARLAAVLAFLLSLVLAVLIITDALPALRGPAPGTGEWYWPYLMRPLARWWPALLSAVLLVALCTWWVVTCPRRAWPVWLVTALALSLQLGILYADRPNVGGELVDRTLAKDTSGYAAVAGEISDLNAALADYPELMPAFDNEHARTHPPGLVAAFYLGDQALRRWPALAEWLARPVRLWRCTDLWVLARPPATAAGLLIGAWLPMLVAALVPVVGWLVARRLYDGAAVALAASLSAMIPALLVFAPTPDQVFALLALVSLWGVLRGLDDHAPLWLGFSGVVLSVMTFLSIGNAAWAAVVVGYAGLSAWRRGWLAREWLVGAGALAIGGASLWLIYGLGWGVAPWSVVTAGLDQHYLLVTSQRGYGIWLAHNPLDFILFAGLPVIVGWFWVVVSAVRWPRRRQAEAGLLAVVLAIVLLVLLLSGGTRGEVGRLWLVFMPLTALLGAGGWTGTAGQMKDQDAAAVTPVLRSFDAVLIFVAQLALALAIGLTWRPLQAVILPVVVPSMAPVPADMTPIDAQFMTPDGRSLTLTGFGPADKVKPGESLNVHLVWTADGPTLDPYTIFVHVVDTHGELVAQQDGWPVAGTWPTTCWRPGAVISDPVQVQLPPDLPAGEYTVITGLYRGPEDARLPTSAGPETVLLDRFVVEAAQP